MVCARPNGRRRASSRRRHSATSRMSNVAWGAWPCFCTASRSTASSGAVPSPGCRRIAAASRRISWRWDSPKWPKARASHPMRKSRCSLSLLDTLGIDDVDLIANDSGGAVAQLFLVRHPERVRTLLLTNCDAEPDSPPPALLPVIALSKEGKFVDQWLAPWHADTRLARSPEGIGGMCYAEPCASDRRSDRDVSRPAGRIAAPKGVGACVCDGAGSESVGRHRARSSRTCACRCASSGAPATRSFRPRARAISTGRFGNSRGVRRIAGSKLFWPEERPDIIAEEALRLWR